MIMRMFNKLKMWFYNIDSNEYNHVAFIKFDDIWIQVLWNKNRETYSLSWQEFVPDHDEGEWYYAQR